MKSKKNLLFLTLALYGLSGCASGREKDLAQNVSPEATDIIISIAEQGERVLPYVYQNAEKLGLCSGELERETSKQFSVVHAVGNDKYIVELLCFMGAYQGNYQFVLYSQQGESITLKPLTLDRYEASEAGNVSKTREATVGGLFDYNPAQKTLQVTTKYRGLADCGSLARYQWENDQFKLVEYRIKEKCDGQFVDPEKYAKVYP